MNLKSKNEASLDGAEVWQAQLDAFQEGRITRNQLTDRLAFVKRFYLGEGIAPFVSKDMVDADPSLKPYYDNYYKRLEAQKLGAPLDFFEENGAFYDLNESCIVRKEEVELGEFSRLFALRLAAFQGPENTARFLTTELFHSFGGDHSSFGDLLIAVQAQSDLPAETRAGISWWTATAGAFQFLGNGSTHQKRVQEDVPDDNASGTFDMIVEEEGEGHQSAGIVEPKEDAPSSERNGEPEPIPGNFTQEEVIQFFSFLYQDRGDGEGSFLLNEQVEEMFQHGLQIPAQPLAERFKLNISLRYTKKLAEYFFYQFIVHHNPKAKRRFLVFLGHYLEDYAGALDQKDLKNINKNMTGEKPKSYPFKVENYLPARLR